MKEDNETTLKVGNQNPSQKQTTKMWTLQQQIEELSSQLAAARMVTDAQNRLLKEVDSKVLYGAAATKPMDDALSEAYGTRCTAFDNLPRVFEQAEKELAEENFRLAVERKKEWLRRPWWVRIFPWKVKLKIERR